MAKRLLPLLDRVLVEKLQPVNKSIGGVLLPDTATSKACLTSRIQDDCLNSLQMLISRLNLHLAAKKLSDHGRSV